MHSGWDHEGREIPRLVGLFPLSAAALIALGLLSDRRQPRQDNVLAPIGTALAGLFGWWSFPAPLLGVLAAVLWVVNRRTAQELDRRHV